MCDIMCVDFVSLCHFTKHHFDIHSSPALHSVDSIRLLFKPVVCVRECVQITKIANAYACMIAGTDCDDDGKCI